MSSCLASSCICFQTASCTSGISASWPTDGMPRSCLFAFSCSAGSLRTEQHTSRTKDSSDLWLCPKCAGPNGGRPETHGRRSTASLSTPGHCRRMKQLFPSRKLCVLWHGPLPFALSPNKSLFPASTCIGSASAANPRGSLQVALPRARHSTLLPSPTSRSALPLKL